MEHNNCKICNKEFTNNDYKHHSPDDFIRTCTEHLRFSHDFNYEMVQLELGIINELPEKYHKCGICKVGLSEQEVATVEKSDFIITCLAHREVRKNYQIDISILWFEFKKEYPNAVNNNQEDWKLFHEWNKTRL